MVYLIKINKEVAILDPNKQYMILVNSGGRRISDLKVVKLSKKHTTNSLLSFINMLPNLVLYRAKSWDKVKRHADMLLLLESI